MSAELPQRDVVGSVLAGVLAGFLVVGCAGGPLAYLLERRLSTEARSGWNLVPVVVFAQDLPAGTVVTFDLLSQRSLPEQFVTPSLVKPDAASYIVSQVHHPAALAGDVVLWSGFEAAIDPDACLDTARRLVVESGNPPSPAVQEVLDALATRGDAAKPPP